MAVEAPKPSDVQVQDPVVEAAEKDLREIRVEKDDTKAVLQGKIVKLNTLLEGLQDQYDEANLDHNDKKAIKLLDQIQKGTASMQDLEEAKKTASDDADTKREKLADHLDDKAEKGTKRAETKMELEAERDAQTAIIDSTDPTVTIEQRKEAHKERADAQKSLDILTAKEKRDHAMEEAKRYKVESDRVHATEEKQADADLKTNLEAGEVKTENPTEQEPADAAKAPETPAAPNAPAAAPENNPSLSDQADRFAGNMVVNIIGSPPKTGWDKFTTNTKVILMQIGLAIAGGGNHSWGAKLSEPEREIAKKVMGLTITDDGEVPKVDATATSPEIAAIPKCKLEWGKPDPEFIGPDKTTQDVFAQYFGKGDWLKTYERVCELAEGKPTIKDIEGSYSTPHTPEDDKLAQLITDMGVGEQKDANFLDMVSRKGYLVLDKDTPAGTPIETGGSAPTEFEEKVQKDVDLVVGMIKEKNFTAETPFKEFQCAYIEKNTTLPFTLAQLQNPDGLKAYAESVVNQQPQSVIAVLVINDTTLSPEVDAVLGKDNTTWTDADKGVAKDVLIQSLTDLAALKTDVKLGAFLDAGIKKSTGPLAEGFTKIKAALIPTPAELAKPATATPDSTPPVVADAGAPAPTATPSSPTAS